MIPDNPAQVAVVGMINSFNRAELLRTALPSLAAALRTSKHTGAITVFDAGSTDGSCEFVREFQQAHPEIPVVLVVSQPGEPNTFSDGINRGCAAAMAAFPNLRWFFLFETDNWMADASPLDAALALGDAVKDIGAIGFTVRKYAGTSPGYGCRFPTALEFVLGAQLAAKLGLDRSEGPAVTMSHELPAFECDAVYTSPIVIRREAWEKSGGLDADQFPFSDCDIDWAWRLKKQGWKQAVLRTDKVVHDNKETLSKWSHTRVFHLHKARLRLIRRHRRTPVFLVKGGLMLRHLGELLGLALLVHKPALYLPRLKKRWALLMAVPGNYGN